MAGSSCRFLRIDFLEDQKSETVHYTDPTDLFMNGVMDTGRGCCGNMALSCRAGPTAGMASLLACVGPHSICRYDDGQKTFNIEATLWHGAACLTGGREVLRQNTIFPRCAVDCGSDFRALTPHEMLAMFLVRRARHFENVFDLMRRSRTIFLRDTCSRPSAALHFNQTKSACWAVCTLFEPDEKGHLGRVIQMVT